MNTFIRAIELWLPDTTRTLLEFGGGIYPGVERFGSASETMCFGHGEGLPGRAWEAGRPIVLKAFDGSYFKRTKLAAAEGLTCGIALPVFVGDDLTAVMLMFYGDDAQHAGAIELWHNQSGSTDLSLDEGYYGTTSEVFEFMSRQTDFRKGVGLPGMAWGAGLPVFMPDLGKGTRFLRADSAVKVGINRGLAIPCAMPGPDQWVMAFLSALATPIARRFETWVPDASGASLQRVDGFCEKQGLIGASAPAEQVASGSGALGRAWAGAVPTLAGVAVDEPGAVGAAAREAGWQSVATLPVIRDGAVAAVVVWYL